MMSKRKRFPVCKDKLPLKSNDVLVMKNLLATMEHGSTVAEYRATADHDKQSLLRLVRAKHIELISEPGGYYTVLKPIVQRGVVGAHTKPYVDIIRKYIGDDSFSEVLRLVPYLVSCLMDGGKIDLSKISTKEYGFLLDIEDAALISLSNWIPYSSRYQRISTSKEFFMFLCEVAWSHYVDADWVIHDYQAPETIDDEK